MAAQAVVAGAVPPQRQVGVDAAGAPSRLDEQDLLLGLQALQGQLVQGLAHAGQEGGDGLRRALHVEAGDRRADLGVALEVGLAQVVHGQPGDQLGDAVRGQGLVGGGTIDVRDNHSLHILQKQPDGRWLVVSEMFMDARQDQTYAGGSSR